MPGLVLPMLVPMPMPLPLPLPLPMPLPLPLPLPMRVASSLVLAASSLLVLGRAASSLVAL